MFGGTLAVLGPAAKKKALNGAIYTENLPVKVADGDIKAEIVAQIAAKSSIAPRDVAQSLSGEGEDWRKYLPRIRKQATDLHSEGMVAFVRKKKIVSPDGLKGVYRLAKPQEED